MAGNISGFNDASYKQLETLLDLVDDIRIAHVEYLLEWIDDKVHPVGPETNGIDWLISQIVALNGR